MLRNQNKRRGGVLIEYALIICGVALVSAGALSLFGHKTSDLISLVTAILPGAHTGDLGTVQSGHLIETAQTGQGNSQAIDLAQIQANNASGQSRLGTTMGLGSANSGESFSSNGDNGVGGLIVESQ